MAFWDDWDFEWVDQKVLMITMCLWAVLCIVLFKGMFFSMDTVNLFGIPWKVFRYIIAVAMLPLTYIIVWWYDNH